MILDKINKNTTDRLLLSQREKRKTIGQFFTSAPIATYMGNLLKFTNERVKLLDAGAGTGILTAAALENLFLNSSIEDITVDMYENDIEILPLLKENIILMQDEAKKHNKKLTINIIEQNFILSNANYWKTTYYKGMYDIVIANPPYKKISKGDAESIAMSEIVHGQPNMYFLFMGMAVKLLKPFGEFVFIVPRSWTTGLYFSHFRKYFFDNMIIDNIHLFISRNKVFSNESVLQETIIIKATKSKEKPTSLKITSSNGYLDFHNLKSFTVPYDICVRNYNGRFLFLPTSIYDVEILKNVECFSENLLSLGFKLKTGLVVDFRATEYIRNESGIDVSPLFWASHINNGSITFPIANCPNQYVLNTNKSLLMKNTNYIFLKRFTSKEESRRLQPAVYIGKKYNQYISTENHLNFITKLKGEMSEIEAFGLFVIFNSTIWDKYFRILNGSTQVNANEANEIPLPNLNTIKDLGNRALKHENLTTEICDYILEDVLYAEKRSKRNII